MPENARSYYFCTYFDRHYLPRALALFRSLARSCAAPFHLFALCLDDDAFASFSLLQLPNITAISLTELEQARPELRRVKGSRSRVEYYYTCGPNLLLHLLERCPEIDLITYLDSDLFFFSDPKPLFDELDDLSVGIIEHRVSKRLESFKRFGTYNVGWISFRRHQDGMECLRWWAAQCLEWCYDRVEDTRFADQKYLDEFPRRFRSVCVIQHKGANLAPWNVANYRITERDGRIWVDEQPLIFFHYQGFKMLAPWLFDTNLGWYRTRPSSLVRHKVFGPYIQELNRLNGSLGPARTIRARSRGFGLFTRLVRAGAQVGLGVLMRAYVVVYRGNVL